MRVLPILLLGILTLFCSGCMTRLSVAENRRVGVVALIPEKIQTKYIGFWAFSNQGEDVNVPEAGLGESVTASTVSALRSKGFDAVPLSTNRSALWDKYDRQRKSLANYFTAVSGDTERRSVGAELKAMAAAQRLDAVAVIVPAKPTGGGEANVGVGDYGFGTISSNKDEVSVYTRSDLLVLSGQTLKTKARWPIAGNQLVDGVPFEAQFRRYSPDQQRILLQAMKELFRSSAQEAIAKMAQP